MNHQNNNHHQQHENDNSHNRHRDLGSNQLKSVLVFNISVTVMCVFVVFASIYTAYSRNISTTPLPLGSSNTERFTGNEPDVSDLPLVRSDSTKPNQSLPNAAISETPVEPINFNNISDKPEDEISDEKISNIVDNNIADYQEDDVETMSNIGDDNISDNQEDDDETMSNRVEQKLETDDRVNHEHISEGNVISKVSKQLFGDTDAKHALNEDNVAQVISILREILESQKRVEDYAKERLDIEREMLKIEQRRYILDYTAAKRKAAEREADKLAKAGGAF